MQQATTHGQTLALEHIELEGVRNLARASLVLDPGLNVITGDNGQGKTSLLEAVYLACTTKSFRTPRVKEAIAHDQRSFRVAARVTVTHPELGPLSRAHQVEHAGRTLRATLDGNSPSTLAAYAVTAPVVAFHPEELALSNGPAAGRRRLLDRVALYGTPGVLAASARYTKALRARQELLKRHGNELEIAAYERIVAEQGAALTKFRELAFARLEAPTARAFREIAAPSLELQIRYRQGGSDDVQQALHELEGRRPRDARAGAASFGPHRDDLTIELCGHAASVVASQGQHRTITLALKAAEAATIFEVTGLPPIRLLDDVSSELDRERTDALFRQLTGARGQVLLTTPRPDLLSVLEAGHKAKRFQVVRGVISEL